MSAKVPSEVLVGLEVHQQIASASKLFCACPVTKSDELPYQFIRRLRPAQSELGRLDPAAVFEFAKGKSNRYLWSPETSCLVEADEEPPHPMAEDAFEAALLTALTLRAKVVDEVHVMRKIVIDGSNTSGFQRTAVLGLGGFLKVDGRTVGVQSVTVEEDAARIMGEDDSSRLFSLDRLGVPLVEVALDPIEGSPELVGKVALHLGRVLRSTGRVARGLGTIRQDLNVSVMGGAVVEVKGVQKLNLLPKVVDYESRRQRGLVKIAEKIQASRKRRRSCTSRDVTRLTRGTSAKALRQQLSAGGVVHCVLAPGMGGLFGWEPFPGVRLGREVAEVARASGLGGVVHSDEFDRQGITDAEALSLRRAIHSRSEDGLVLVAGPEDDVARCVPLIMARIDSASGGVPAETRAATEDGETRYMRPRPGSQRMYPETDIPDVVLTKGRLSELRTTVPEDWEALVQRLVGLYSLSADLALKLYDSGLTEEFERQAKALNVEPSLVASVFVDVPPRMAREGVPESALTTEVLKDVLREVSAGHAAKEAIPDLLKAVGSRGITVAEAVRALGLRGMGEAEVRRVVDSVVSRQSKLIEEKGEAAFAPLMGEAMKELRGKADGASVSKALMESLQKALRRR
jgi:glutamyl-tRNA(Gln) amidotransferase subunit E